MLRTAAELRRTQGQTSRAYSRVTNAGMNTVSNNGWNIVYDRNGGVGVLTRNQARQMQQIVGREGRDKYFAKARNGGSVG